MLRTAGDVAIAARDLAEERRIEAVKQKELAESTGYVTSMNLARAEFENSNTQRGFELLGAYLTQVKAWPTQKEKQIDMRGFFGTTSGIKILNYGQR